MSKPTKRTITYPIDQKIKDINKMLVTDRNNPKLKQLQADVDYYMYGLVGKK